MSHRASKNELCRWSSFTRSTHATVKPARPVSDPLRLCALSPHLHHIYSAPVDSAPPTETAAETASSVSWCNRLQPGGRGVDRSTSVISKAQHRPHGHCHRGTSANSVPTTVLHTALENQSRERFPHSLPFLLRHVTLTVSSGAHSLHTASHRAAPSTDSTETLQSKPEANAPCVHIGTSMRALIPNTSSESGGRLLLREQMRERGLRRRVLGKLMVQRGARPPQREG